MTKLLREPGFTIETTVISFGFKEITVIVQSTGESSAPENTRSLSELAEKIAHIDL